MNSRYVPIASITVIDRLDQKHARAEYIYGGVEPELFAVVDVLSPVEAVAESAL
jgi:hypothetical protein